MKIIKLRFKNLNALYGEWEIDFENEAYLSDPFFSIIGPTGAGKSTILDAICLSLYGRTPRLDKSSVDTSSIMSQNTAQCFAQVAFETAQGRFQTHWSQKRSHSKSNGKLQEPKHELFNLTTNTNIAVKKKEISAHIIQIIGLDFLQFTRAILLAQGEFSAFLEANNTEKGLLLEKITGLDIYSDLSKCCFEEHKAYKANLKEKEDFLRNFNMLSTDAFNSLKNLQQQDKERAKQLKEQLQQWQYIARLWEDAQTLNTKLDSINQILSVEYLQKENSEPQRLCLNLAKNANFLEADYQTIINKSKELLELKQNIEDLKETINTRTDSISSQQIILDAKRIENKSYEDEKTKTLDTIKKVRELDLKLDQAQQSTQEVTLEYSKLTFSINQLEQEAFELESNKQANQIDLSQAHAYLHENKSLVGLNTAMSGFEHKIRNIKDLCQKNIELNAAKIAQDSKIIIIQQDINSKQNSLVNKRNLLTQIQSAATGAEQELFALDFALDDILKHKNKLNTQGLDVQHLIAQQNKLIELNEIVSKADTDLNTTSENVRLLEVKIKELELALEVAKRSLFLAEENSILIYKIQSLKDELVNLKAGKPCPLCGSLTHPFAIDNQFNISAEHINNEKLQQDKISVEQLGLDLNKTQTNLEYDKKNQALLKEHKAQTLQNIANISKSYIPEFELLFSSQPQNNQYAQDNQKNYLDLELLRKYQDELAQKTSALEDKVNVYKALATKKDATHADYLKEKELFDNAEKDLVQIKNKFAIWVQEGQKNKHDLDATTTDYALIAAKINADLDILLSGKTPHNQIQKIYKLPYELTTINNATNNGINNQINKEKLLQDADLLLLNLHKLNSGYINTQNAQAKLNDKQNILQSDIAKNVALKSQQDLHLAQLTITLGASKLSYEQYAAARFLCFGTQICTEVESKLTLKSKQILQDLDNIQTNFTQESTKLSENKIHEQTLKSKQEKYEHDLNLAENKILQLLQEYGFENIQELENARLNKDDYEKLSSEISKLEDNIKALEQNKQDTITQLASLDIKKESLELKPLNLDEIKNNVNIYQDDIEKIQQELGKHDEQLSQHQNQAAKHAEALDELEILEEQYKPIYALNELIGAADGAKYRNFAQGLSFDIMLKLANKFLEMIDPRYELTTHAAYPFEVMVTDHYQANIIRSSKTLSGGERFIVSLALALGLSKMASKNILIETLFLDEGFGALDQDSLESVLNALSNLQQTGKMIGIISHVESMKERFSNKIEISPGRNGISTISGPGVTRNL
ncbi:nuclease SbcCD subunit C [Gammaproteobacteria bacterium]|nr:nuclease SbcCD subunit C [Gammaproteobacteria bacterium]